MREDVACPAATGRGQDPVKASTRLPPDTYRRPPLSLGVLNCGGLPRPARDPPRPEPLLSPLSWPPSRSIAHTSPPATMGGPARKPGPRQATDILRVPTRRATMPLVHGTYTLPPA